MNLNPNRIPTYEKATEVGTFISEELFCSFTGAFQSAFPHNQASCTFPKNLLERVLDLPGDVVGIRFMFGLTDPFNLNSLKVLIVPCTSIFNDPDSTKPLIYPSGYFDQNGVLHSLNETIQLLAYHVESMVRINPNIAYKNAIRGGFFGKNTLQSLMKNRQCEYVKLNFGIVNNIIKPVLEPLDKTHDRFSQVFLEFCSPCPPKCGDGDGECVATAAVMLSGNEEELNLYRQFRDEVLIELKGGAKQYEMYYFISPLISAVIGTKENKKEVLGKLYEEKISPFKRLILEKKYYEALTWLELTFEELAKQYQINSEIKLV